MPHPTHVSHRRDIDGLRALAVLLVIVHHVSPALLPGGFVGVDVFFVLSGFLMTGVIDRAQCDGSFEFAAFMWRRARRIVPPLMVMLVVTLAAGACVLTAPEFVSLGRHVVAGSLSVSNVLLLGETGYFDTASSLKPLLHLWSLGVEEQFYLVWPLLLAAMPSKLNYRLLLVIALSAVSLLVSETLAYGGSAQGFYMLHARAWEFGVGGALALMPPVSGALASRAPNYSRRLLDVLSVTSVLLIIVSATLVDSATAWPGVHAVPVALGTAGVIAAGPTALLNRGLLSANMPRWIGERSYALYLWHWPPLAFLHILASERGLSAPTVAISSLLLMAPAAFAAHLSLRFIERPLRHRSLRLERGATIGARHLRPYAAAIGAVALTGAAVIAVRGLPGRYGASGVDVAAALRAASPDSIVAYERDATHCQLADRGFATWCRRVGGTGTGTGTGTGIAVFGDSHAEVLFAGLHAERAAQPMLLSGRKGCAPILQDDVLAEPSAEICRKSARIAHAAISRDRRIGTVLIASRGPAYLSGIGYGTDTLHRVVPVSVGDTLAMRSAFEEGLIRSIEGFTGVGQRVVLVLGIPEIGFQPDECLVGRPFGLRRVRTPCALQRAAVDRRNAAYRDLVTRIVQRTPSVVVFDATDVFCTATLCRATDGATVLYSDGNHLTLAGSRRVAARLLPLLSEPRTRPALALAR
jgi:peptidoglycan/LPS O-acetylase OafA/YrhL